MLVYFLGIVLPFVVAFLSSDDLLDLCMHAALKWGKLDGFVVLAC